MKWIVRIIFVIWLIIGIRLYFPVFYEFSLVNEQFIGVWRKNLSIKNDYDYLRYTLNYSDELAKQKIGLPKDGYVASEETIINYYQKYIKPFETAFYAQLQAVTITYFLITLILAMVVIGIDWTYRKKER